MPHGHCYLWQPGLLFLHMLSDALIALAYFSIPFTLVYFVRERKDLEFDWMFLCFAAFIIACGATHVMEIWVIWHPVYWLSGGVKVITALASVPTAILLVKLMPGALALPNPAELRAANAKLSKEITERKRSEEARRQSEETLRGLFEFAPDAIALLDREGRIMRVNAQAERFFGYPREAMLGQPVEMLMPERFRDRHVTDRESYTAAPRMRPMGAGLDLFGRRKDGSEFAVDIMLSPMPATEDGLIIAVVRDITERRRAEQQIKESLKKEALLRREIHHRVKNNLQVISSMLFLQSTHVSDAKTLEVLRESQGRVRSIAFIHEKLSHSDDLSKIEFSGYLRQLAGDLFRAYRVSPETVGLTINAEGVFLGIDTAIPLGLIINELVSNALKHGLPAGGKGEICIDLRPRDAGVFALIVRDNGAGLPERLDVQQAKTLGLKLVSDLTRQLGGAIEFERNQGAVVKLTFTDRMNKEG